MEKQAAGCDILAATNKGVFMKLFVFTSVINLGHEDGVVGIIAYNLQHAVQIAQQSFPTWKGDWVKENSSNLQQYNLYDCPEPGVKFYQYGSE